LQKKYEEEYDINMRGKVDKDAVNKFNKKMIENEVNKK